MDRATRGRAYGVSRSASLADAVSGLEEFALAFPDSRGEVIRLMESSPARGSGRKHLHEAASRIAAVDMLEILKGR